MEELEAARLELLAVRNGTMKANDACTITNNWLKLSVYDLAWSIAQHKTKAGRANALSQVKIDMPDFYDDVASVAKIIFNSSDH
jgi:hypothetical protein